MTACLLYAKIHKNKAENLLHLMLYFSKNFKNVNLTCIQGKKMIRYSYISVGYSYISVG